LTANTIYHYRIVSKDAANNTATSGDGVFSTLATNVPVIPAVPTVPNPNTPLVPNTPVVPNTPANPNTPGTPATTRTPIINTPPANVPAKVVKSTTSIPVSSRNIPAYTPSQSTTAMSSSTDSTEFVFTSLDDPSFFAYIMDFFRYIAYRIGHGVTKVIGEIKYLVGEITN
jgi:hypothetical protein